MQPGGKTVLVVDDDASIRLLCRVNLELDGHKVLEAATLDEARASLREESVSLLVLDVHVGREDGRTLVEELRANGSELPVVLLTGSSEAQVDRGAADRVIVKPFAPAELTRAVVDLAGSARAARVDSSTP